MGAEGSADYSVPPLHAAVAACFFRMEARLQYKQPATGAAIPCMRGSDCECLASRGITPSKGSSGEWTRTEAMPQAAADRAFRTACQRDLDSAGRRRMWSIQPRSSSIYVGCAVRSTKGLSELLP